MTMHLTLPQEIGGSLAGHLLIATPAIGESCLTRAVIYMCSHNEEGAMGVIINHPIENIGIKDIFDQLQINTANPAADFPVHFGGPVEANRGFILHSSDYVTQGTLIEKDGIAVTASVTLLQDMAKGIGPKQGILMLGYAGWSQGQLESEIESGGWIVVPASKSLVFDTENDTKWAMAIGTLGFDMGHFSSVVGHA